MQQYYSVNLTMQQISTRQWASLNEVLCGLLAGKFRDNVLNGRRWRQYKWSAVHHSPLDAI